MPKYTEYRTEKTEMMPTSSHPMGGDYFYDKTDKSEYRRRRRKTHKRSRTHKTTSGGRRTHKKRTEKRYRRKR